VSSISLELIELLMERHQKKGDARLDKAMDQVVELLKLQNKQFDAICKDLADLQLITRGQGALILHETSQRELGMEEQRKAFAVRVGNLAVKIAAVERSRAVSPPINGHGYDAVVGQLAGIAGLN
jgi:hypothetical protein